MKARGKRRLWALLVSAGTCFGVWAVLPGQEPDRLAFAAVARGFENPPLFISGNGSRETPWALRSFSARTKADPRQAPLVVSLGDDPDGFFQSSPPAPIDLAVVLTNFHRLGARKAATAAVLAWEAPDPIGLAALEKALGRFDSMVMATPLSRGVSAGVMPPAYRRASLPTQSVRGNVAALPVVNRVPIPGVILGGPSALAGFSTLESEPGGGKWPLLAVWEDRVVFSFPLLVVLQRLDLTVSEVEIELGKFLRLGRSGRIVPIDAHGRLARPLKSMTAYAEIPAEALIDGGDELFPKEAPDPVILRDDRSGAGADVQAFSRALSAHVAALASDDGVGPVKVFRRLTERQEIGSLAGLVALLGLLCGARTFVRHLGAALLAGMVTAAQYIGLGIASVWLPGLAALAGIAAAVLVTRFFRDPAEPEPEPPMPPEEVIPPTPDLPPASVIEPPAEPPMAKKAAKKQRQSHPPKRRPRKRAQKKPPPAR